MRERCQTNGSNITGNNPLDTSIATDPSFAQAWVAHLVSLYGTAANGGVPFYDLDNEPVLWDSSHRDVHPNPLTYDELTAGHDGVRPGDQGRRPLRENARPVRLGLARLLRYERRE